MVPIGAQSLPWGIMSYSESLSEDVQDVLHHLTWMSQTELVMTEGLIPQQKGHAQGSYHVPSFPTEPHAKAS